MKPNPDPAYFLAAKWTIADITHFIHRQTKRRVSYSTLKRWRNHLGIYPDENLLYSDCDRDGLVALARWLDRGGKVKPFATRFKQFIQQQSEAHHG
jgi:glutathione S-transferase